MRKGFWKRLVIKLTPHTLLPPMGNFARTFSMVEKTNHVKLVHLTARRRKILRHGKPFIELFPATTVRAPEANFRIEPTETMGESPIGIGIFHDAQYGHGEPLARIKLGFEKKAVIVEAIQGARPSDNKYIASNPELMRAFKTATGKTWPRFLIEKIEAHAKEMGFKRVKIIKPEFNSYYHAHLIDRNGKIEPQSPSVQRRMHALYYGVARRMHYREEGNYFVKEL